MRQVAGGKCVRQPVGNASGSREEMRQVAAAATAVVNLHTRKYSFATLSTVIWALEAS